MGKIGNIERNLLLLVPLIILIVAFVPVGNGVLRYSTWGTLFHWNIWSQWSKRCKWPPYGELIGLSYGAAAFDMNKDRKDQDSKRRAENAFKQNDKASALLYWQQAISQRS